MNRRQTLLAGAALLALAAAACGRGPATTPSAGTPAGSNPTQAASTGGTPTAGAARPQTGTATPGTPAAGSPFPGDPPATQANAALDQLLAGAKLPPNVTVLARRDYSNEFAANNDADVYKTMQDTGRETGNFFIVAVDGTQRIQMAISKFATADGAKKYITTYRPRGRLQDAVDLSGIGDEAAGFKTPLGSADATNVGYNVAFIRGPYHFAMLDAAGDPTVPPTLAIAVMRAIDEQFKAN